MKTELTQLWLQRLHLLARPLPSNLSNDSAPALGQGKNSALRAEEESLKGLGLLSLLAISYFLERFVVFGHQLNVLLASLNICLWACVYSELYSKGGHGFGPGSWYLACCKYSLRLDEGVMLEIRASLERALHILELMSSTDSTWMSKGPLNLFL